MMRGFTLIETVIAMAIMASGLLLMTNTWGGSFARLERSQRTFEFASLLERKMTEIDLKYRGKPLTEIQDEEGEFEGFPEFKWEVKAKDLEFPDLSSVLVGKDGGADAITMSVVKQLTEALSKGIKEVTVTVTHTRAGKKPFVQSVTTYFVNYDASLNLGVPVQ